MSVTLFTLRAISTLLVGLYAGGVFFTVLAPSVNRLPGQAYVPYWQAENTDYGRVMPVLVLASLMATVATAFLSRGHGLAVGLLTILGALLVAATIVVTLVFMEPLNRAADGWNPSGLPDGWEAVRAQWLHWHLLRTVCAVAAFGCLVVAQAIDHRAV